MSATKPETRCKHLARDIEPLVSFLERFRPSCHSVSVRRADLDHLRTQPEAARTHGFVVDGDRVLYHGFELRPTDCGTRHALRAGRDPGAQ